MLRGGSAGHARRDRLRPRHGLSIFAGWQRYVAAEDATNGLESFLGLHYPASDIPKQVRELYRRNWLRTIPDIDYVPQPLVPEKTRAPGSRLT